jgi:2-keto-4-pentenoate hydratase
MSRDEMVRALIEGRRSGGKMTIYPGREPKDMVEAFAIQTAVREAIGWTHAGWKIGCTSERAQRALNTNGPFPGPVYRELIFASGVRIATLPENSRVTEPEIAFTMAQDCKTSGRPLGVDDVLAAVASVHPAIEIVNPRLPRGFNDSALWYVADGGLNHCLVLGSPIPPLPRADYAAIRARVFRNGEVAGEGSGANALGGPELALTWLANALLAAGQHLRAGDVVTTGVVTPFYFADQGDLVEAVFEPLGSVSLRF